MALYNPDFEVVGEHFNSTHWGVAMRKGEEDIKALVDLSLRLMYETGFLQDSLKKWWGGWVLDTGHGWCEINALPPTLALGPVHGLPFHDLQVIRDETVPGMSNCSADEDLPPPDSGPDGYYNHVIEWSANWDAWDGPAVDTPARWAMSFRTTNDGTATVDITPRRLQAFSPTAFSSYYWTNTRLSDEAVINSGIVVADGNALITVAGFTVSPLGNRLDIEEAD